MLWLPFSSVSVAKCVRLADGGFRDNHVLYFHQDWVGDAVYHGGFYASGDIYIDYDYLMDNQSKGVEFDQRGSLYFLPPEEELTIPEFGGYSDEYDVAYTTDKPSIDYWINANSGLDVDYFYSRGDIFIVKGAGGAAVPLPASGWLSASALFALFGLRRMRA